MIIQVLGFFIAVVLLVIGFLYAFIFILNRQKRKVLTFDAEYEKKRAENYPPPFPNGWFNLCSSNDVKKGQVIEVEAFGQKLAVFRGEDGKVGVLDVYCPHLNANLADGRVEGNNLVCAFHAWNFDKAGKCVHIPYSENGHVEEKTNTKAWTINEDWGLILVWYHCDNKPPSWSTKGYLDETKEYKYYSKTSEVLRIHLQDFAENGADYAHFKYLHNLLTMPLASRFVHLKHVTNIKFGKDEEKHIAYFTDVTKVARNKDGSVINNAGGGAAVTYYGPGFLVFRFKTRLGNPIIVKTFTPIGELKVRMDDYVYAPKGMWSLFVKYIIREATTQFNDDIDVWERKSFAINPILVKGDGPIMKMRAWYSQFYTANSYNSKVLLANNSNEKVNKNQSIEAIS